MKRCILLIEDNPGDAALVSEAIKEINGEVVIELAHNGDIGLATLRRMVSQGTPPDLIISNFNLPALTGPQVLGAVKRDAALRSIPFIMLTSSDQDCDRRACAGADDYLIKGNTWVDIQGIAKKIIGLLPGHLGMTASAPF